MITSETLIGGAVVCLILMTVGFAFVAGLWLGRRAASAESTDPENPDRVADMINGLYQWTNGIARDVSDFRQHVDNLQSSGGSDSSGSAPANALDPKSIEAFQSAHQEIQERLTAAEATLQSQAEEIEVFVNEARCDALTGVANRRAFDEEMSRHYAEFRRYGTPLCVCMIDIDFFKMFNDTHGHQAGDAVLAIAADRLQTAMRTSDIVTRYGGEEFAIILVPTALQESCRAAERARLAICESPIDFESQRLDVTASCGVAEATTDESISSLIQRADKALYAAKESG